MINSYPSVFALGHRAIPDLMSGNVVIEEKVDGSQFSMSVDEQGELACRSKGKELIIDHPEGMFHAAIDTALSLKDQLLPGWVYRCEYLAKRKHNALAYERVPVKHIIVFDICRVGETYMSPAEKAAEAQRLGLECVPLYYEGPMPTIETLKAYLDISSILGGMTEGMAIKNYNRFTLEKKISIARFVRDGFKELNSAEWKKSNPTQNDFVQVLIGKYRTDARFLKAVGHLRESGALTDTPKDIGLLVHEIESDVYTDSHEDIRDALFDHFWPNVRRGICNGVPDWYKNHLAQQVFDQRPNA